MNVTSRAEFDRMFPTEESAIQVFAAARWGDEPRCACGYRDIRPIPGKAGWWHCKECRSQSSLRSGTPLHGSRKPFRDWLFAIWANVGGRVISARRLCRLLGYASYETAWRMLHKVRIALAAHFVPLVGKVVAVGSELVRIARHARGDSRQLGPQRLAVGDDSPAWPLGSGRRRYLLVPDGIPGGPEPDALAGAVLAHDPRSVRFTTDRTLPYALWRHCRDMVWDGVTEASTLISGVFGGVSRRYYPNYLVVVTLLPRPGRPAPTLEDVLARFAQARRPPATLRCEAFDAAA